MPCCHQAFTSCECVAAAAAADLCLYCGGLQLICVLAVVGWPVHSGGFHKLMCAPKPRCCGPACHSPLAVLSIRAREGDHRGDVA